MHEDRTKTRIHKVQGPTVRAVKETDIDDLIKLFRLNYGDDYPHDEFYNDRWLKRALYSPDVKWLAFEDEGLVASGALVLGEWRQIFQIGELGRFVVHPSKQSGGLAQRVIQELLKAADNSVEFVFGELRTIHPMAQKLVERSQFKAVGFWPQNRAFNNQRQSHVFYAKLLGNAKVLRSKNPPQLTPQVEPLASHALAALDLSLTIAVKKGGSPYPTDVEFKSESIDRSSLATLLSIKEGRVTKPMLFGPVSLEEGMGRVRAHSAVYLLAKDEEGKPRGAIGFVEDRVSQSVRGIELVAESDDVRGYLCREFVRRAEQEFKAVVIEVNVSAYDSRLQQTFLSHGFQPVAYLPSMVFHHTERLDVVKMMKLNVPYDPGKMELTEQAKAVVTIVQENFT